MQKKVTYKGEEYTIEIKIGESNYFLRCIETNSSFLSISWDALNDIEKLKPIIIEAIEYKPELLVIEEWDGII
jgi:hypothetical protein